MGEGNEIVTLTAFQSLFNSHGIVTVSNCIKYDKVQTSSLALQFIDQIRRSYLKS